MSEEMPPGWEAKWDARIGRWWVLRILEFTNEIIYRYYVNHSTRTTQWEDPRLEYQASKSPELTKKDKNQKWVRTCYPFNHFLKTCWWNCTIMLSRFEKWQRSPKYHWTNGWSE